RFESSTELSNAVAADPNGIGFIALPYVLNARALKIRECDLSYEASAFTVKSEEYPLARRLYLYTPEKPSSSLISDFVQFALSDEGQQVAEREKFISQAIQPDVADTQEARFVAAILSSQSLTTLRDFAQTTRGASRLAVTFRFRTGSERLD